MSLNCPNCGCALGLRLAPLSLNAEPQDVWDEPQPSGFVAQNSPVVAQPSGLEPQLVPFEGVRSSGSKAKYSYPDPNFQAFWKVYPRRVGKASAFAKWRLAVREVEPQLLIAAATSFAASMKGTEPQFIPYPEKWLAHGRWQDEAPEPAKEDARYLPYDHEAHMRALEDIR